MARLSLRPVSVWLAALACLLVAPVGAAPITYDMVTVGNPGNGTDTSGRPNTAGLGQVDYNYQIGKFGVTIGQYTAFLNAVAATDTYSLYNSSMASNGNIAGIQQSYPPGNKNYFTIGSADRPITFVNWFDAARFANWMANGQPTGAQSDATTENGAYNVNGLTDGNAVAKNATNPNTGSAPTFYIPNQNEWYKAAYYSPQYGGAGVPGYYAYATQSDTAPDNDVGSTTNQANYNNGVYSVTQSSIFDSNQNYLTDVGAFSGSQSFYGTFDQSGSVWQWNDLDGVPGFRELRGGYWGSGVGDLASSTRFLDAPSVEVDFIGFRLASPVSGSAVPEIDPNGLSAVLGLIVGGLGLLERRRYAR
jgi:sulfatase modifying factor 1